MRWFRRRRKYDAQDFKIIEVAVGNTMKVPEVTFPAGTVLTPVVVTLSEPLQTPVISVAAGVFVVDEQTGDTL